MSWSLETPFSEDSTTEISWVISYIWKKHDNPKLCKLFEAFTIATVDLTKDLEEFSTKISH